VETGKEEERENVGRWPQGNGTSTELAGIRNTARPLVAHPEVREKPWGIDARRTGYDRRHAFMLQLRQIWHMTLALVEVGEQRGQEQKFIFQDLTLLP
jgi:hypothetical protein